MLDFWEVAFSVETVIYCCGARLWDGERREGERREGERREGETHPLPLFKALLFRQDRMVRVKKCG